MKRARLLLLPVLIVVGLMAVPRTRVAALHGLGQALVADDPVTSADVIVISVDAGGAGVLEAADLVRSGVSKRVAVFAEPPAPADIEFSRRGIEHHDDASQALSELRALGVADPIRIPTPVDGTTAEGRALAAWTADRGFRSIVMITTRDHSRRTRRVLRRALEGRNVQASVRSSKYSDFDANTWWHTRTGVRTEIIELQKLVLDLLTHPLS